MSGRRLIPFSEAARRLGVSVKTLHRLREGGALPAVRTGTKGWWRVAVADLMAAPSLTVGRAARLIGVHSDTAFRWVRRGKLKYGQIPRRPMRIGSARRVSLGEIMRVKRNRSRRSV